MKFDTTSHWDNVRPDYSDYPTTKNVTVYRAKPLRVKAGEYIVDEYGDFMIVTSGNDKNYPNDFLRDLNEPFIRAKYLGNKDDCLYYAQRIRRATKSEIKRCKAWEAGERTKVLPDGQAVLL